MSTTADTAPRTGRHANADRRGPPTRGHKHASARSGRCPTHRRGPRTALPQVTSDARPDSARRSVGSLSYYDPTTANFTSLDPLVAVTEEPYGYVGGNPANRTDPSGLAPWDGLDDWSIDLPGDRCFGPGDDCENPHNGHGNAVSGGVVDFASGVLDVNPITATTNALGLSDTSQYANECSGWYRGGQASMIAAELAMGVGFARQSTRLGDAAYRSRFLGADSYLFGNASLGAHTRVGGGLFNPITRGPWRLGWSVHGVPVLRVTIAGWKVTLLVTSGF